MQEAGQLRNKTVNLEAGDPPPGFCPKCGAWLKIGYDCPRCRKK